MKLAAHVACHSSVKTIDHLGLLLKKMAKDTTCTLGQLKLHRTKCSKIICKVLAPSMLKELIDDIGDSWYSVIVDESTDTACMKHLALVVRYYSFAKKKMMTDFLGIVITPQVSAEKLYEAFTQYLNKVGLDLKRLLALGTDGAANLCGIHNSLYALLKRNEDCSNLHLVKCICHGLDKCTSKASEALPGSLELLLRETRAWFSHCALRRMQYTELCKSHMDGKSSPPQLVKLATTRWLSWYGAVKTHADQYEALKTLFADAAAADPKKKCLMTHTLSALHEDSSHLLYLTFLKSVLREAASINVIFQSSVADISKVYKDLKSFVFFVAGRVIRPEKLKKSDGGMLKVTEIEALKVTIRQVENHKPLELVGYGEGFWQTAAKIKLSDEKVREVQTCCADFLIKLIHELSQRLPSCIEAVEKMRAFSPDAVLRAKGRPEFKQLPLDIIRDPKKDMEALENQWMKLGTTVLEDICPDEDDINSVNIIKFWTDVWELKDGAGRRVFEDLAKFVLSALSLPLSNAIVERLFRVLAIVKVKLRNKLGMEMLEAILRVRSHLQANEICCTDFDPSSRMIENFNSKHMYQYRKSRARDADAEDSEEDVDNPSGLAEIGIGLSASDDIDDIANAVPIPEWDEMLDLLAEVDALTSTE